MPPKESRQRRKLKVKVVPLAMEHLDAVMEIEQEAFTTPWLRDSFVKLLENPATINFVALNAGRVVGYSCTWFVIDSAELGNIAVSSACQGQGVGRCLMDITMRACRRQNVESLFLEVRSSNSRAVELYEHYGFSSIGLRPGYYSDPREDALIMKLKL
ncbi:MAG: ribosomal-protein-alanine N-acetyltransferase [Candidatus Glassbacteria bacterium]|nr:ribosomal-protein-alanine N-acetyltransferase [Candidatus Glassbacteria bacterium]